MSDDKYQRYRYSITCHTDREPVLFCLRALCQYAEQWKYQQIGWGGTGVNEWRSSGKQVTFRFTDPDYRAEFERVAGDVLPEDSWSVVDRDDNDPAQRQRPRH